MAFLRFLKPLVLNKYTAYGALALVTIGAIFFAGFVFRGSCDAKKELKQSVKELKHVVKKRDQIHNRYSNMPLSTVDELERVLSVETLESCPPSVPNL